MMEETEEMKRWEVQNRAVVTLYRKKTRKKIFKKVKNSGTKFHQKSEKKLFQKEKVAKETRFHSQ